VLFTPTSRIDRQVGTRGSGTCGRHMRRQARAKKTKRPDQQGDTNKADGVVLPLPASPGRNRPRCVHPRAGLSFPLPSPPPMNSSRRRRRRNSSRELAEDRLVRASFCEVPLSLPPASHSFSSTRRRSSGWSYSGIKFRARKFDR